MSYLACAAIIALFIVAWLEWRRRAHAKRQAENKWTGDTVAWLQAMKEGRYADAPTLE